MFDWLGPAFVPGILVTPLWLEFSAEIPHEVSLGVVIEGRDGALSVLHHVFEGPPIRISWALTILSNIEEVAAEWALHVG